MPDDVLLRSTHLDSHTIVLGVKFLAPFSFKLRNNFGFDLPNFICHLQETKYSEATIVKTVITAIFVKDNFDHHDVSLLDVTVGKLSRSLQQSPAALELILDCCLGETYVARSLKDALSSVAESTLTIPVAKNIGTPFWMLPMLVDCH